MFWKCLKLSLYYQIWCYLWKNFFFSSENWKNSFLTNFDSKKPFFLFHTHDFQGSKKGLKCLSMGCKHYYALFRSKWSDWTQKSKNGFYKGQLSVHSYIQIFFFYSIKILTFVNSKSSKHKSGTKWLNFKTNF